MSTDLAQVVVEDGDGRRGVLLVTSLPGGQERGQLIQLTLPGGWDFAQLRPSEVVILHRKLRDWIRDRDQGQR
jgi:hypothetical protein